MCLRSQPHASHYHLQLSMDGFRRDYLDIVDARGKATPNFAALIAGGVRAEDMVNAFVTVTCPNHWSMATGMHVEPHGVVANLYFDQHLNASFSSRSTLATEWYDNGTTSGYGYGQPCWVTYQRARPEEVCSAMVIWPGENADLHDTNATCSTANNNTIPFHQRVDHIIHWFSMEKEPAHLGILYFWEPDQTGHDHGPLSLEVEEMILELDATLGYMIQRIQMIQMMQIFERTNLIVRSDHGMNEVLDTYKLSDFIHPSWYNLTGGATPASLIIPQPVFGALFEILVGIQLYGAFGRPLGRPLEYESDTTA